METLSPVRDVPCRIVPRSTLSSADLQRLGQALDDWSLRELPEGGLLRSIDAIAVFDLIAGDLMQEALLGIVHGGSLVPDSPPTACSERPEELYVFCAFRGEEYNRVRTVASLRSGIPADLVQDVLLDERSWDEMN
jgi:hypothetical protein